jgi:hypothetical protein
MFIYIVQNAVYMYIYMYIHYYLISLIYTQIILYIGREKYSPKCSGSEACTLPPPTGGHQGIYTHIYVYVYV